MIPRVTWQYLSQFHKRSSNILIPRSREVQKAYDTQKQSNNILRESLFPKESKYIYQFLPNNYPYNVEEGIEHYVLWFNPTFQPKWLQESNLFADLILKHEIIRQKDVMITHAGLHPYIFWKNIPENTSVKDIVHYQVFYRKYNSVL